MWLFLTFGDRPSEFRHLKIFYSRMINSGYGSPDEFLYLYYLDIDPVKEAFSSYMEAISKILENFWIKGYKAVTACDFEEHLLKKEGYRWKDQ